VSRQVVILSGVSGSGKSTYIRNIFRNPFVVSADDFFLQEEGKYNFDPTKLGAAHASCFRRFINACLDGWLLIIVDNTNTTSEEIAPYVLGAEAFGYAVEIVTMLERPISHDAPYDNMTYDMLDACARRNTHGVPLNTILKQHERITNRCLPPWWKHTWQGSAGCLAKLE
jgi:hypothetical protein